MEKQILIAEEVAEILRVDKQRVYELVRTNQIPFIRLGERQYRFSATAIRDFLEHAPFCDDCRRKIAEKR